MADFKETSVIPRLLCPAVGSLPHSDPDMAVDLILNALAQAPHSPQLSKAYTQQMWIQVTEGLPRFQVDLEAQNYHFDTSGDPVSEIEQFYVHYLAVTEGSSAEAFAISRESGRGIHRFLARLRSQDRKFPFIKVQVTGPLSFAMTVTDENRKPIFYHPTFRDVAVKGMGLKAVWMLEPVQAFCRKRDRFFR